MKESGGDRSAYPGAFEVDSNVERARDLTAEFMLFVHPPLVLFE